MRTILVIILYVCFNIIPISNSQKPAERLISLSEKYHLPESSLIVNKIQKSSSNIASIASILNGYLNNAKGLLDSFSIKDGRYGNSANKKKDFKSKGSEKNGGARNKIYGQVPKKNIRNFSIIAHVDHGKSTLADRFLEITGTIQMKAGTNQVLDRLQVERERGITVKAQTASLIYTYKEEKYLLNLIDTPGHVDFSNEVSRSLTACQGVLLLVDANQGVQAQTVANFHLAFNKDLEIIPVLNKIDMNSANTEVSIRQLNKLFGYDHSEILKISAKFGTGVEDLLSAIIERIPPPETNRTAPLRAIIFDSWFDKYRGAIALVYIKDGEVKLGDEIRSIYSQKDYTVRQMGVLRPYEENTGKLLGGQVGFIICDMRSTKEACIGDTLCLKSNPVESDQQYESPKPMVYAGVYPLDQVDFLNVRKAIDKLTLNDPAVTVLTESSPALGQGWRLGFLGLLHMEVFNQRLEQEHGAKVIIAAPSVTYKVKLRGKKNIVQYGGEIVDVSNPANWPDPSIIVEIYEPIVKGTIITPDEYIGKVIPLCIEKRGIQQGMEAIDNTRVMLTFLLPLNEIIIDFHDALKSVSSGFASFNYEDHDYSPSKLVKMIILLNGVAVEELATIVHTSKLMNHGKRLCKRLLEVIPRQMVQVAIQAAVGNKIYARETLKAFRKDVIAKLYGGDVSRKKKLLQKQAEGKKKMKLIANIQLPRETFIEVLRRGD